MVQFSSKHLSRCSYENTKMNTKKKGSSGDLAFSSLTNVEVMDFKYRMMTYP